MATTDSETEPEKIDITPTPRVLRMLGEVDLSPGRCFAEFIDNSLDEGIEGTPGRGPADDDGGETLRIEIETPTMFEYDDDYDNAKVVVRDNGSGMSKKELEKNLRAGYSGKDPVNELGLFGMGFNIATARLGNRTTVRTTRTGDEQWAVATIDFRDLERNNSFKVNVEFEEKHDSSDHGTEIIINQLDDTSRTLRRKQNMPENLGDWYTPVLERENVKIVLNGEELRTRPACVWSKERTVEIGGEEFPAKKNIDKKVGEGHYCKDCWTWWDKKFLQNDQENEWVCPSCDDGGNLVQREQRVWGWLGVQRFFDKEHFGIDLIRNGRIIEKHDKSMFFWENPEGVEEKEYPIDTTHWGGRIVGELHIDFVPVNNTKNSFEKSNDRWEKIRDGIRGKGPLRPQIANKHGYEPNRSPLGQIYKGYRTGNEVGKKRLVPGEIKDDGSVEGDNSRPEEWAEKFWNGEDEYQDDSKWWQLVEQAEKEMRDSSVDEEDATKADTDGDSNGGDESGGTETGESGGFDFDPDAGNNEDNPSGLEERSNTNSDGKEDGGLKSNGSGHERLCELDEDLSGSYGLDEIDEPDIQVNVKRLIEGELAVGPVEVSSESWNERTVKYDPNHSFFTEFENEPIDSVLIEVAGTLHTIMDNPGDWRQTRIFAELQRKYCADERVSPEGLANRAKDRLNTIKSRIAEEEFDLTDHDIDEDVEESVRGRVWRKTGTGEETVEELLKSSAYLEYASDQELIAYFQTFPEQFFDGTVWGRAYESLGSEALKQESVNKYSAYLDDVVMLSDEGADYDIVEERPERRFELKRAAQSLQILEVEANDVVNS